MVIFPKLSWDTLVPLFQPKIRYYMIISPKLSSDTLGVPNDLKYIMTSDTCNVAKTPVKLCGGPIWWSLSHFVDFGFYWISWKINLCIFAFAFAIHCRKAEYKCTIGSQVALTKIAWKLFCGIPRPRAVVMCTWFPWTLSVMIECVIFHDTLYFPHWKKVLEALRETTTSANFILKPSHEESHALF